MNVMEPLVSVVIPCYNHAQYLAEALESIIAQTYENTEIIIVNDGSADNTLKIANRLIAEHGQKNVKLIGQENGGPAKARNAGIAIARGKYILPLDADDKIHPDFLKKTVNLLEAETTVSIAYTDKQEFGDSTNLIHASEYDFKLLRFNNQLNNSSLYLRKVWEDVGGYNTDRNIMACEDWDFWISAGEKGHFAKRIPEPLFLYRITESSLYTEAIKREEELRARLILNHRGLYTTEFVEKANRVLEDKFLRNKLINPRISVILPTYNRPDMLKSAIQTILNQTFRDYEIIVVNDGGVDVENIVSNLNINKNISYIKHAFNRGLSVARNSALKIARGKYIAYLDDDDVFYPDHLETLVGYLENNKLDVAYTNPYRALQIKERDKYLVKSRELRYSQDFDYDQIFVNNFVHIICVMHLKSCLDKVGMFDEFLTTHEDWDFLIRLSVKYTIAHIDKVTAEFSWRTDRSSLQTEKYLELKKIFEYIYKKYKKYVKDKPQILEAQIRNLKTDFFYSESYALTEELSVIYEQGFYEDEGGWRWIPDEALMEIVYGPKYANHIFILELTCGNSKSYNRFPFDLFVFQSKKIIAKVKFDSDHQKRILFVTLPKEISKIELRFVSEESYIPALVENSNDVRRLSVRLGNLSAVYADESGIKYFSGWYEEKDAQGNKFYWMGKTGKLILNIPKKSVILNTEGYVHDINYFENEEICLVLRLNDKEIDKIKIKQNGIFAKKTELRATDINSCAWLSLESNQTFIPSQLGINADGRELSLIIKKIFFEDK
jgi:glycosyltransferase involved in cell wall biosynthesis